MPLLVRKKLVSADCADAGCVAITATAKQTGETILTKARMRGLPIVLVGSARRSTRRGGQYSCFANIPASPILLLRQRSCLAMANESTKAKAPRSEPQRLFRLKVPISWSAG